MSEQRMADMALIDAALQGPQTIDADAYANDQATEQHEAISSPLTEIAKELSPKEQKEAAQINLAGGAGTNYGPIAPSGTATSGTTNQQSLLKQKARATAQSAGRAMGSVQNGLGNVSMPGGLLAPLLVLLVLSMLLVKYNGHTRLVWLWLVATTNAALAPVGSQIANIQPGQPVDASVGGGGGGESVVPGPPVYLPLEMDEW